MDAAKWRKTLEEAYERFCGEVDAGRPTFIDDYASEHPAEFFAVMSEAFFTESAVLARDWPELYRPLALFYRQDPAGRAGSLRRSSRSPLPPPPPPSSSPPHPPPTPPPHLR